MILYVDETENDECFIVAGLMADSVSDIRTAYKQFKKGIRHIKIPDKYKAALYTEFKSSLMDNDYKSIKKQLLKTILEIRCEVLFSLYKKNNCIMKQKQKESVYIMLISRIIAELPPETTVVFDRFGKTDFENRIIKLKDSFRNITTIIPEDSQREYGLQFADNICSVIRRHICGTDEYDYYSIAENIIRKV